MSTDKQPIPGPDQTKSERRFEETGTAEDPHKERDPPAKSTDPAVPSPVRPPPD